MKIVIVSNSHPTNDIRLYHKLSRSLAKIAEVWLLSTSGISNAEQNPFQAVVSSESKWFALYKLYVLAKRQKPDVVICVEPLTIFIGLRLQKKLRTKLVFDIHEFFADAYAERYPKLMRYPMYLSYLMLERWMLRRCDFAFAVNELILRQLSPKSDSTRELVVPNYPVKHVWDYNQEIPHTIESICKLSFDLIYIGGLTPDRGLFVLLDTINILKRDVSNLNVLIVGKFFDPALEQAFYDKINEYHLNSIIYYQSWLPPEKIGVLLKCAKIGLWIFNPANKRMYNALPLKVLEYLSAGLPVVSIKSPLMYAIIKQNNLGICTDYSPQSLAAAILSILRLPDQDFIELQKRCLAITVDRFNWEALEPAIFSAIKSLVRKQP